VSSYVTAPKDAFDLIELSIGRGLRPRVGDLVERRNLRGDGARMIIDVGTTKLHIQRLFGVFSSFTMEHPEYYDPMPGVTVVRPGRYVQLYRYPDGLVVLWHDHGRAVRLNGPQRGSTFFLSKLTVDAADLMTLAEMPLTFREGMQL
jgi:hypothetical protein